MQNCSCGWTEGGRYLLDRREKKDQPLNYVSYLASCSNLNNVIYLQTFAFILVGYRIGIAKYNMLPKLRIKFSLAN